MLPTLQLDGNENWTVLRHMAETLTGERNDPRLWENYTHRFTVGIDTFQLRFVYETLPSKIGVEEVPSGLFHPIAVGGTRESNGVLWQVPYCWQQNITAASSYRVYFADGWMDNKSLVHVCQ